MTVSAHGNKLKKKCKCLHAVQGVLTKKNVNLSNAVDCMSDETIDTICQLMQNVIYRNIGLSKLKQSKLRKLIKPRAAKMKYLTKASNNMQKKRKILKQEGGAIGAIIAKALPTIISFVSSMFTKN